MPCGLFCFHHERVCGCRRLLPATLPVRSHTSRSAGQCSPHHEGRMRRRTQLVSALLCPMHVWPDPHTEVGCWCLTGTRHGISTYRMEPAGPCHDTLSVPYRSITLRMRSDLSVNPLDIAAVVVLCRPSRSPLDEHLLTYQTIQHVLVIQLIWDPASRDTHTAQQLLPAHLPSC
jgi:hypothetical protein